MAETELQKELMILINKHSMEGSNTPGFILAGYLEACLLVFEAAVQQRETWYGRDSRPTIGGEEEANKVEVSDG